MSKSQAVTVDGVTYVDGIWGNSDWWRIMYSLNCRVKHDPSLIPLIEFINPGMGHLARKEYGPLAGLGI